MPKLTEASSGEAVDSMRLWHFIATRYNAEFSPKDQQFARKRTYLRRLDGELLCRFTGEATADLDGNRLGQIATVTDIGTKAKREPIAKTEPLPNKRHGQKPGFGLTR